MEITRRNFIQLIAGGAAGIHMTPLPWKLMDDTAIWTQNWSWVPVPAEGRFHHEKGVCQLCRGGCGIEVRMVDDRAVKIEGRTDYPVNPGGVCPLGAGGLQLLYNETIRFPGPMKRVGPRGEGQFAAISWDEAYTILSARIQKLRQENRPEALAAIDGHPMESTVGLLVKRFLHAVGSPNYMTMPTLEDTYAVTNRLMFGTDGPMAYDLENADYILSFGCGLIEGWGSPGRVIEAWGRWHEGGKKSGPKVIQVESRASNTASKADGWVAPRPGTEAVLALSMAHVMIQEGLTDTSFLDSHTSGYENFKNLTAQYTPEKASEITGVGKDKIIAVAREFGKARSPLAIYGQGKGDLNGSVVESMAVMGLNALKGNIDKPGGVILQDPLPYSPWPELPDDPIAREGVSRPRLDEAGSDKYPFAGSIVGNLPEAIMKDPKGQPVDTLLVLNANPAFTLPGAARFRTALANIPFIVSFSPYTDETSRMADLILPDHTALEKMEDTGWPTALQYPFLGLSTPIIPPLVNTRHSGDAVIKLADKVGGPVKEAFPWKSFEGALKARLQGVADVGGLTSYDKEDGPPPWEVFAKSPDVTADYEDFDEFWENIQESGFWFRPTHDFRAWSSHFKTPSGRFEFLSDLVKGALQETDAAEDDSLTLVPYGLINISTGWLPSPPFLTKTLFDTQLRKGDSMAHMNPETAAKLGLREGDFILVTSEAGEIKARLHIFEGSMPGVVYLPFGLGHTAYGVYLKGKGSNPADILKGGEDPISGQKTWWTTRVKVSKA